MEYNFNQTEQIIIKSADVHASMHVYLTTNEKELAVLQSKSDEIRSDDPLLKLLASRMLATVQAPEHKGVGIAAPQVGINKRVVWVQRFDKKDHPFEFFINPKIRWKSKLSRFGSEGCLSIPERREEIQRSYAIQLQYQDLYSEEVQEEIIEGFTAVIMQHEIDHLEGILFTDRQLEQTEKTYVALQEKIQFFMEKGGIIP